MADWHRSIDYTLSNKPVTLKKSRTFRVFSTDSASILRRSRPIFKPACVPHNRHIQQRHVSWLSHAHSVDTPAQPSRPLAPSSTHESPWIVRCEPLRRVHLQPSFLLGKPPIRNRIFVFLHLILFSRIPPAVPASQLICRD
jgi:hypothetical protein